MSLPMIPSSQSNTDLGDEGLSPLEKIYLFSRSRASVHRVFIAHALPSYLVHVSPQEAIEYVLPLLDDMATDEDDVQMALATSLVAIIWWFFSHCQLVPDDVTGTFSHQTRISVQAFTPILRALLRSSNIDIVGAARFAVIALRTRIQIANRRESHRDVGDLGLRRRMNISGNTSNSVGDLEDKHSDNEDDGEQWSTGFFGWRERQLFEREILQRVVIV